MKHFFSLILILLLLFGVASAEEDVLSPQWDVPEYVTWLIDTAEQELDYREDRGWTKYGEWSGDGYAQWCAEFLCWCVDQVDQQHGTNLLKSVFPRYSGTNTGKDWYIDQGRYVTRNGHLENIGYQWIPGNDHFLQAGEYIPQPGDWVFFTWTDDTDTDHVAMVEYCTRNTETGAVTIHVIEGNNPDRVQHNTYPLTYNRILGFGTVHNAVNWTLKSGYRGKKVTDLQEQLALLGLLSDSAVDGRYGTQTVDAVRAFQTEHHLHANGIANIQTQNALEQAVADKLREDPAVWQVTGDDGSVLSLPDLPTEFSPDLFK